jgi:hypothetical protein
VGPRDSPRALEEEAVAEFHDVGFVYRRHLLPLVTERIGEREFGNPGRGPFGDDLQAFHDARYDLVLEARVEIFGVLTHDDEIDVVEPRIDSGQVPDWTEIRVELERFSQADVDARESFPDWRRDRPLERDLVPANRVDELDRQRVSGSLERFDARVVWFPVDRDA